MQILGFILEDFNKLYESAVPDVESAGKIKHSWIALRIHVELGNVFATDEDARVLIIRINRWNNSYPSFCADAEIKRLDRIVFSFAAKLFFHAVSAHRATVTLNLYPQGL